MEEWSEWDAWNNAENNLRSSEWKDQMNALITIGKQLGQVQYTGERDKWGTLKLDTIQITQMDGEIGPTADRVKRFNRSWYKKNPLWLIPCLALFLLSLATFFCCMVVQGKLPQGEIWQKLASLSGFAMVVMDRSMWFLFLASVVGFFLWFLVDAVHGDVRYGVFYDCAILVVFPAPVVALVSSFLHRDDPLGQASLIPLGIQVLLFLLSVITLLLNEGLAVIDSHNYMTKQAYDQECEALRAHLEKCKKGVQEAEQFYEENPKGMVFIQKQGGCEENTFLVCMKAVEKYYTDLGEKMKDI